MGKGYYIKKDQRDGLTLNTKKDQFIKYLQGLQGDWLRFKIYERDVPAANGLSYNMELIERKSEQQEQQGSNKVTTNHPNTNPTEQVD
jgi:hypothetical protein